MSAATSMRVGGEDGDAAAVREEAMGAAYAVRREEWYERKRSSVGPGGREEQRWRVREWRQERMSAARSSGA